MGRDRSLEEFLGGESDGSTGANADADADDPNAETESGADGGSDPESEVGSATGATADADGSPTPDGDGSDDADADENAEPTASAPDDVGPAAATYRWEPDGVRCAECGTAVEQLWSGESGQVCAECKEW